MKTLRQTGRSSKLVCLVNTTGLAHTIKRACRPYFMVEPVSLHRNMNLEDESAFEAASLILVEWDEQTAHCVEPIAHAMWKNNCQVPIIALCDPKSTAGLQALLTGADYAVQPPVDALLLHVIMAAYRRRAYGDPGLQFFPNPADTAPTEGEGPNQNGNEPSDAQCYTVGPLTLDERSRVVYIDGDLIDLTERPFDLLCYLARRAGECCTREQILREVWGLGFNPSTNVVDVQIYALRNALRPHGMASAIQTVRGYGYRLQALD